MTVTLPPDLDAEVRGRLVAAEKAYSQDLQRQGRIAAIWRVAGQFANYCVFDVQNHDELHECLSGLPMFDYIQAKVEPLAQHPNSIS